MDKNKAKDLYTRGCNEYLRLFCEKHDFDFEDAKSSWVGGNVGDIVLCGDYYIGLQTIITDIDENAPEEEFIKHYDYCIDAAEFNLPQPNFHSWLRGCPRTSPEGFERLRAIKKTLEDAINEEKENNSNKF